MSWAEDWRARLALIYISRHPAEFSSSGQYSKDGKSERMIITKDLKSINLQQSGGGEGQSSVSRSEAPTGTV